MGIVATGSIATGREVMEMIVVEGGGVGAWEWWRPAEPFDAPL